ncbi:hypothetical protein AB4Y45_24555 [Paraburkholderia sp. EG287A]|uniref:hypothetical protein n=1 Tax=unclassified Paraburkholderia TaxID=2615204 RepID=UPI0034D1F228
MRKIPTSVAGNSINIEGIPDAVRVVALRGSHAKRLADLALHRKDLAFADDCLVSLTTVPEGSDVIQEALWRSAIVHFFKCFGDGARFKLSPNRILRGEDPKAMIVFRHFENLRNKHFVHDENSYLQCIPVAAINDGSKAYKVEEVLCVSLMGLTLEQAAFDNFRSLVIKTREWVEVAYDDLTAEIKRQLEAETYAALLAMPAPQIAGAEPSSAGVRRPTASR